MNNNVHVICPHCGTEFEIADTNRKNVQVSGEIPDGIYTLIPKNDKRLNQLKDMGIDITKFFGMNNPSVSFNSSSASSDDVNDEISDSIRNEGYVEGKSLWRRWVMAQMFRAINYKDGFDAYYKVRYPYQYAWRSLYNEIISQTKIKDVTELAMRQKFFNKETIKGMIQDYINTIKRIKNNYARKKCKGVEYVHIPYSGDYFITDLEEAIEEAKGFIKELDEEYEPQVLEEFMAAKINLPNNTPKGNTWRNAFMGAGAYYTLDNLIKFHNCRIDGNNMEDSLRIVQEKVKEYERDYYKLFMFMKKVIADNNYVYGSDF